MLKTSFKNEITRVIKTVWIHKKVADLYWWQNMIIDNYAKLAVQILILTTLVKRYLYRLVHILIV